MVAPPSAGSRKHGWKLHVSATPLSAALVLARAGEVLVRGGCSFKFGTDIPRVSQLLGARYDRGGSGKFITAYPADDDHLRVLAAELDRVTADLAGPRILSDRPVRPGSLVHYRYGEFSPDEVFTDDGVFESRMVGPDGSVVVDQRLAWFAPPPWAVSPLPDPGGATAPAGAVVLAGRFRVTGAIRHANKGGIYEAVDQIDGGKVVVKQARAFTMPRLDGTDARDRLREEARMLQRLAPLALFPAFIDLVEEQGDLFLIQEAIPGITLDQWAQDRREHGDLHAKDVKDLSADLVAAVKAVHGQGLVLRDLKPSNVMVGPDGRIRMVDAELVVLVLQESVWPGFTPAYAAPEVNISPTSAWTPAADCFSLGVTLFCMATAGCDPHWVSGPPGSPRPSTRRWEILTRLADDHDALTALLEPVMGLTETDPNDRWTLERVEEYLAAGAAGAASSASDVGRAGAWPAGPWATRAEIDLLLTDGLTQLIGAMTPRLPRLWPADAHVSARSDACDAWRGAAGQLATLARAAACLTDPALTSAVADAVGWVGQRLSDVPRMLPGLCFGRAGTAWALYDAGRLLGDQAVASRAVELACALPTAGPSLDVAGGLAGAGLARLHLWDTTADPRLLQDAIACAESLLASATHTSEDLSWPMSTAPAADTPVRRAYGFAHGTAGIGMFLLAAWQAVDAQASSPDDHNQRYLQAALAAGDTLVRAARIVEGTAAWPTEVGGHALLPTAKLQWCNGAPGIGTFLIRLWAATGEQRFADLAAQCPAPVKSWWTSATSACCGLAGTGHLLLDLAEYTGEQHFKDQTEHLASLVHASAPSTVNDNGYSYGKGSAGTLDFLLRLRNGGTRPWLPQPPAPASHRL
jgi:class IV lanthipeptide synthase